MASSSNNRPLKRPRALTVLCLNLFMSPLMSTVAMAEWPDRPKVKRRTNITVGPFIDKDVRILGHAQILQENLLWHLSRGSEYHVLADKQAIAAANKAIVKNNTAMTRDDQWVDIGHALGASHILMGETRVTANESCVALAQIVQLKSKKQVAQTLPGIYDCKVEQLRELARQMYEQLTGRKTKAGDLPPLELKLGRKTVEAKRRFEPPKSLPKTRKSPPRNTYTVFNLMDDANSYREFIIAFYLAIPVLFLLLGGVLRLFGSSWLPRLLKSGIQSSLILVFLHGLALGACFFFLKVEITDKFEASLLLSPLLGFIGMLAVARILSFRSRRSSSNF